MENFIEIYDNALPDDVCDLLTATFNFKEANNDNSIQQSYTMDQDIKKMSSKDLHLDEQSFLSNEFVPSLDYYLHKKLFEYDKKFTLSYTPGNNIFTGKLSKSEIKKKKNNYFEEFNYEENGSILNRFTYWKIKKYKAPDDGYNVYHTDWGTQDGIIKRTVSAIFYLNDVEEGGETEFYHYDIKIKPKKGRLILFPSFYTHLHKGHKPISDDKYTAMCWITV